MNFLIVCILVLNIGATTCNIANLKRNRREREYYESYVDTKIAEGKTAKKRSEILRGAGKIRRLSDH